MTFSLLRSFGTAKPLTEIIWTNDDSENDEESFSVESEFDKVELDPSAQEIQNPSSDPSAWLGQSLGECQPIKSTAGQISNENDKNFNNIPHHINPHSLPIENNANSLDCFLKGGKIDVGGIAPRQVICQTLNKENISQNIGNLDKPQFKSTLNSNKCNVLTNSFSLDSKGARHKMPDNRRFNCYEDLHNSVKKKQPNLKLHSDRKTLSFQTKNECSHNGLNSSGLFKNNSVLATSSASLRTTTKVSSSLNERTIPSDSLHDWFWSTAEKAKDTNSQSNKKSTSLPLQIESTREALNCGKPCSGNQSIGKFIGLPNSCPKPSSYPHKTRECKDFSIPKSFSNVLSVSSSADFIDNPPPNSHKGNYLQQSNSARLSRGTNLTLINLANQDEKLNELLHSELIVVNGKYYLALKILGQGGSGNVYDAFDLSCMELRAIKIVNLAGVSDELAQAHMNEISCLQKLQSCCQWVIKMFDYQHVVEKKQVYIVMERGDTDLYSAIKNRTLSYKTPLAIKFYWSEMLHAVKHIHKEGIIHNDLKPANFIISKGRLKLIDFGISAAVGTDKTSVVMDTIMGTYNYMSPECFTVSDSVDGAVVKISKKADVWSLGCILYSMVYGSTPFAGIKSLPQKMSAICSESYEIKFDHIEDVQLLDVMKQCLQRQKCLRPSIDDLLNHPYLSSLS